MLNRTIRCINKGIVSALFDSFERTPPLKSEHLSFAKSINATLAVTFKTPKVALRPEDEPTCLTTKDTDFFEVYVLRQFFINMSRVVPFRFVAYPEDRAYDSDKSFRPLHYHAVVRSDNDAKFKAVAPRKYATSLRDAYAKVFGHVIMPSEPIWIDDIHRDDPENCYESYIFKHYCPSKHLVTNDDFLKKSIAA